MDGVIFLCRIGTCQLQNNFGTSRVTRKKVGDLVGTVWSAFDCCCSGRKESLENHNGGITIHRKPCRREPPSNSRAYCVWPLQFPHISLDHAGEQTGSRVSGRDRAEWKVWNWLTLSGIKDLGHCHRKGLVWKTSSQFQDECKPRNFTTGEERSLLNKGTFGDQPVRSCGENRPLLRWANSIAVRNWNLEWCHWWGNGGPSWGGFHTSYDWGYS